MPELLRLRPQFHSKNRNDAGLARGGADGAIQLRGTDTVEKTAIHGPAVESSQRAAIRIRQNRFTSELARNRAEARGNCVESLIPGNPLPNFVGIFSGGKFRGGP